MDRISVFIESRRCWGRILGEDSGTGACDLCVQICPEVFEKPTPDRCARVRAQADAASHAAHVRRAAERCPVDAIRVVRVADRIVAQLAVTRCRAQR